MTSTPSPLAATVPDAPATADRPLDRRVVLSGLWASMLFVFAYVDIFGFFRADVIDDVLAGELSGPGVVIDQRFLALTTLYVVVASLMVAGSLLLRYRANRIANLVLPAVYAVTIIGAMVGETWVYYLLGSVVELVLLAVIAAVALRWR